MTITMTAEHTAAFSGERAPTDLVELLREIAHCPDAWQRENLTEEFLRLAEPLHKAMGAALCREKRADRNTWLDEFIQTVRCVALRLVEDVVKNPDLADDIGSYRAFMTFRCRSAAQKWVDSAAGFNQASGMAGLKRRVRELERTRTWLYQNGHEPTDEMIVEETNKRMARTRADYRRQGMECTVEDLHVAASAENIEDHAHPVAAESVETESELHSTERTKLILLCIAACDKDSDQLGQIARLWFAPALSDAYDDHPTAASIAQIIGIEASTARAKVAKVKTLARQVAREQFGIRVVGDDG